jgi:hypothetical protein
MTTNSNGAASWRDALAAYREAMVHDVGPLPASGLVIKAKQVSLQDLMLQGKIPDSLSGLVNSTLQGKKLEMTAEHLPLLAEMFGVVIKACAVEPPVADVGDEDHLGLNELKFEDQEFIFNWANAEAIALTPFRQQHREPGAAAPVGEDLPQNA